ncbi:MAG: TolC family protein, partial [Verrucomicrobiota bacterium]
LSRSRQEREIATDRLSHLIGLGSKTFGIHLIDSPLPVYKKDQLDLRVTSALAARPDLRSAGLAIAAAGKRVGLAKAEVLTFTAALNAKEVGNDFLTGPGFDISIPFLNQNQGNIALAKANLEKSARHYLVIRDRVILEVREAHHRLEQAQESLETWQKRIFPPLQENIMQTQKAFELGDTSFLLVLEATRKFADAEMKVATANADARRAFAELERSVGGRLDGLISK